MSDARMPLPVDDCGPDDITDDDWVRADGPHRFYERLKERPDQWAQVQRSLAEIAERVRAQPPARETKAVTPS